MRVEAEGRKGGLGPQQRLLLAALVLARGQAVSKARLIDLLWEEGAPAGAVATLRTHILHLRRVLEPDRRAQRGYEVLVSAGGWQDAGYALRVSDRQVDALEFVQLAQAGRCALAEEEAESAIRLLDRALDLWSGPALGGVSDRGFAVTEASRLEELRLVAREDRIDALLSLGREAEAIGEANRLIDEHQLRERLWSQLVLALYRSGRTADALAAYRRFYHLLDSELGVAPGRSLQRLHQRVLRADPSLERSAPQSVAVPVPRQLPPDSGSFTGRSRHVRELDALLPLKDPSPADTLVIFSVTGLAGVGKTTLAVHWMHRVADRFPDGQLYLNLRGYAPASPVTADEALAHMLRSLGVPPIRIPDSQEEKETLYRSLLAGKRMLVLLDNAAGVDQVRPLLPGSSTCLVVVTSRNDLRGLTAFYDAQRIGLDVFTEEEAVALLARTVGEEWVAAEREAAGELAELCSRLPLALRISAANLIGGRYRRIADMARDLREGNRLAKLKIGGESQTAVRAAFDLSYRALSVPAQRLFRLVGLAPGSDVTALAAAALCRAPDSEAERTLDELVSRHLIEMYTAGRYHLHDLLRQYAQERAGEEDGEAECEAALRRVFQWYLSTCDRASRRLYGAYYSGYARGDEEPADPAVHPQQLASADEAYAWLSAERNNLLSVIAHTARHGPYAFAWQTVDAFHGHLLNTGQRADWLSAARSGLRAAVTGGSRDGQAAMHENLGNVFWEVADYEQSFQHCTRAVALYEELGRDTDRGNALVVLGAVERERGRLAPAQKAFLRALDSYRSDGNHAATALPLASLGYVHVDRGRLSEAEECFRSAWTISQSTDSYLARTLVLRGLGLLQRTRGDLEDARRLLEKALEEADTRPRFSYFQETALCELAAVRLYQGHVHEARAHAERAHAVARRTRRRVFEPEVLNTLGTVLYGLGDFPGALEHHARALDLAATWGVLRDEAAARIGKAGAYRRLGRAAEARTEAETALRITRERGLRILEGEALTELAATQAALGEPGAARDAAERALTVHRGIGHRLGTARSLRVLADALDAVDEPVVARRRREEGQRLYEGSAAPPYDGPHAR
ncbi:BTAD domain-containing putative transcriptional regulator [Streptomyces sp. BPTC-684]|uniref:AfsR/SARP family transcriptional regulator n=1 Tax=Streptomyces sp. BPTC-684 TaxID=3043734 RepID=UPI0024B24ACF|nr:BTAD domain-containing putative transcriptional regulator [Streptomyces sp. BPTC-684]WHM41080.1 BTAD domain-containing putative transcriptional regulator [Streptomyces sp. BPTC-684]